MGGHYGVLDSFLKAYKASEMKGYFPYKWFDPMMTSAAN